MVSSGFTSMDSTNCRAKTSIFVLQLIESSVAKGQQQLSFWGVRSNMLIFNCLGVVIPRPHIVQVLAVLIIVWQALDILTLSILRNLVRQMLLYPLPQEEIEARRLNYLSDYHETGAGCELRQRVLNFMENAIHTQTEEGPYPKSY